MARTLTQQIRKIIKQHYGDALGMFRADVDYCKATDSFVKALSRVIKGEISYSSDWVCDLAKYGGRPVPLDINIGRVIKDIRIQKDKSLEATAANMGVHPDYLDNFEQGIVTPHIGIIGDAMRAIKANKNEWGLFSKAFKKDDTTEEWIKCVIEMYYGKSLWTYRPEFGYEESIAPFVRALLDLSENWRKVSSTSPKGPTLSDMISVEEERRKSFPYVPKSQITHAHVITS